MLCLQTHSTTKRPWTSRHLRSGARRLAHEPGSQGRGMGMMTHVSPGNRTGSWEAPFNFHLSPPGTQPPSRHTEGGQ